MSGVGAKRPRPQSRSRPTTAGKPSSVGAKLAAGGRPSSGSGGHSRDKRAASGRRSRLDENIELDGDFSDEEPAAPLGEEAAAELTLEDTETADERRLRLAKELLRKYDAVAAGPSGGEGDEDEETGSDEESDTGVTGAGATTARRGAGKVFDAIAARLKEDALAASGALYKPLAAAIMIQGGVAPSQVCFRRAHELTVTCVAVSDDASRVYSGSKDCSIIAWDTAALLDAGAASTVASSTRCPSADAAPRACAGSGVAAAAPADGPTIQRAVYPGRKRTKADTRAQELAAARAAKGSVSAAAGASAWTGLRSVIGLGYGGGRIGSTHEMATALQPQGFGPKRGQRAGAAGGAGAAAGAGAVPAMVEDEEGEDGGDASAGGARARSAAASSALALTAPKIIHSDGVSSIVIPGTAAGAAGASATGGSKSDAGAAANAAAIARLRTVPDYRIVGHYEPVLALALSSDGKYLASGGADKMVRLWDPHAHAHPLRGLPSKAAGSSASAEAASAGGDAAAAGGDSSAASGGRADSAGRSAALSAGKGSSAAAPSVSAGLNVDSFVGHKDAVTALAFRRGTHALYSGSADRCVKMWDCDEMSYGDTLFGHQADITSLAALAKDRCVTAGRDRTLRLWKVPEQSQLIFRSHGTDVSTDCVALINESWFVSGGADGSLSLWHASKKRPVYTRYRAHALAAAPAAAPAAGAGGVVAAAAVEQEEEAVTVRAAQEQTPWVSAVAHCPCTDVVATGSGDGFIRLWRLVTEQEIAAAKTGEAEEEDEEEEDGEAGEAREGESPAAAQERARQREMRKRGRKLLRINLSGVAANKPTAFRGLVSLAAIPVKGVVNGIAFSADGRLLVAAVGQEHRLGGWFKARAARNGVLFVRMPQAPSAAALVLGQR